MRETNTMRSLGTKLGISGALALLSLAMLPAVGRAAVQGPDNGGYKGTDVTGFSFVDLTGGGGTSVLAGIDDGTTALTLPAGFSFKFYGQSYTVVCASSNGALYFVASAAACSGFNDFANTDLTNAGPPNDLPAVLPLWSDLTFAVPGAGSVFYQTFGTAGSRRFVVQWANAYPQGSANPVNFEVILTEGANSVTMQYQTVTLGGGNPASNGGLATVGIRNSNGFANGQEIQWSFEAPVLSNSYALLFQTTSSLTAPVLTAPANGAPTVNLPVTLTWNTVTGANTYDVYFGTTSPPAKVITDTAATSFNATTAVVGTTYNWQVVAKNGANTSASPVKTFTTALCAYALSANASIPAAGGGPFSFNITTSCAWTITGAPSWVTITSATSGFGNATINYLVSANNGAAQTATLSVGTQTYTINQAGTGGPSPGGPGPSPGNSGGATLTASPETVTFNVAPNAPVTQTVTLTYQSDIEGAPTFQAYATTSSGTWLTVSPGSGTMTESTAVGLPHTSTATVTITADPTHISPGTTITGTVTYVAAGVTQDTTYVTMVVANSANFTVAPKSLSFTYRQGDANPPGAQSLSVSSTTAGLTFSASASTASGGNWLSVPTASGTTPGSVPVSVNITNLTFGLYSGTVKISSGASSVNVPVTLNYLPASSVVITPGGVVPIYSTSTSIQAGSWISIYGSNLADASVTWNGDFPTSLGGVSVTVDGKLGYLWLVSPTQINLQAPDDTASGPVNVVVTNSHGSFTSTVTLVPISPSFNLLDSTHAAGVILTPDGSGAYQAGGVYYDLLGPSGAFSFNTRPVKAGEVIELFGVGFGPTNPAVPAGQAFTGAAPTVYPVTITIGGVSANVSFAGLTEAGLYQFNVTVPSAASGDQPLQATVNGVQTLPGPVVTIQ